MMKVLKYLFAIWAGLFIYASLSVLFGSMGISAYNQLDKEREKQEKNIDNLKLINRELEESMNSFLYDKDTLAVYAREKGYASPAERFIRIVGLGVNQKNRTSPGDLILAAIPQATPDRTLRIIAFCTGISIFFCFAVFDFLKYLRER